LSDALKITAETLHEDGSILSRAEPETRSAVNSILESAARTLGDMESFVDRYQVVRKRETSGGFVVEKSWSEVILANYKTFKWTTEGGNLTDLRNMLQMHTNTLQLTMQAMQSRSLARLERAVLPIAENINSIHDRVNGDLAHKIDDLHRIIMTVANSTPSLVARDRAIEDDNRSLRSLNNGHFPALEYEQDDENDASRILDQPPPLRTTGIPPMRQVVPPERTPRDSVQSTPVLAHRPRKSEGNKRTTSMDWGFENGSPPEARNSIGGGYIDNRGSYGGTLSPSSAGSPSSPYRPPIMPRRGSSTLPSLVQSAEEDDDAQPGSSRPTHSPHRSRDGPMSPVTIRSRRSSDSLPPPAIPLRATGRSSTPATPSSILSQNQRPRTESNPDGRLYRPSTAKSAKPEPPLSPALTSLPLFEKSLFRNAAILCDVRGTVIEYARHLPDEPDPRFNIEMVDACKEARICVIRKRENREHGGTRLATSIWALSDDGEVRCQQKLSDVADTVPYNSYFQPEKVSLGDAEMCLRFHGQTWTDQMERDVKTNWVNYIFASENDASAFQSAVFGRLLIGSFRTTKTIVLHQGLKGTFAFEEQFANIETLRLWEDDGIATAGAQGGIMALMHISSNFGDGWARWWMNSTKQQVRVREDGFKCARMKGIDVTVVRPGAGVSTADKIRHGSTAGIGLHRADTKDSLSAPQVTMKRIPVKRVTGVKIEFRDDEERLKFVETSQRLQGRMLPLPDL